mgnify:CR=1 FL=1
MSSLKLEFMTETMEYLRPVLRETKTMEETSESIIPDSCPDVTDILHTGGTAYLRGRELGEGSATVSAGVSAMVLVQPEGRQEPEIIEAYIPLSIRFASPELKPGMQSAVQVDLRRLDSHLVNPRKVMVRATVSVTLEVWESCQEAHPMDIDVPGVQILRRTEPMKLMTCLGEKTYTIEDTVRMTSEVAGVRLADYQIYVEHTESRLTGTRAVLKGNVQITVVYLTEQGEISTGQAQLPFSQYIDLGNCQETDTLQLRSLLAGADVELSSDGGGLNVTLQMISIAEVWAMRELTFIGDIYAVTGQVVPEWTASGYESLLDRQCFQPVGRGTLAGVGDQVLYVTCIPGELSHMRTGDNAEFTLPVSVQVLSCREGKLMGGSVRVNLTCSTQAAVGCRLEAMVDGLRASASPGVDGMVKCTVKPLYLTTLSLKP